MMYNNGNSLFNNRYLILKKVGSGVYGKVYEAHDSYTFGRVAVKRVFPWAANQALTSDMMEVEIRVLTRIRHQNIIRLLDQFRQSGTLYLVYEFCENSDLEERIRYKRGLSEQEALKATGQIIEALILLKRACVVHRDIKPANMLVHGGLVKLGDFGFCAEGINFIDSILAGSLAFQAPEVISYRNYSPASDLYSLGVSLYLMLAARLPFNNQDMLDNMLSKKLHPLTFSLAWMNIHPLTVNLIIQMTSPNPMQRISCEAAYNQIMLILSYLRPSESALFQSKIISSSSSTESNSHAQTLSRAIAYPPQNVIYVLVQQV